MAARHGAPAWDTVKVWPPMVSVPVRGTELSRLAAAVKRTTPAPRPLAPLAMPSHGSLLCALHGQSPGALTLTRPADVPAVDTDRPVGVSRTGQAAAMRWTVPARPTTQTS